MNITIDRAIPEDVFELIEVQNQCFQEDFDKYGECPAYQENPEDILRQVANDLVYKIMDDNKIIGDVIVRNISEGYYYLRVLSVIPAYQSLGIGTMAIKHIEQENKDWNIWRLVTPEQSYRNRHFYEKLGYKKIGEIAHSNCLTLINYEKTIPTDNSRIDAPIGS